MSKILIDEATVKLALDYLNGLIRGLKMDDKSHAHQVSAALRQALANEALDKMAENARELGLDYEPAQQEPVAWRVKVETKLRDGSMDVGYQLRNEKMSKHDEPLYTSPPAQRTWVGLTDEEVIAMSRYDLEYAALIGEVQRRLKEKNT